MVIQIFLKGKNKYVKNSIDQVSQSKINKEYSDAFSSFRTDDQGNRC